MRYPISIELRTDKSGYGVVIPDLPGCFSAGDTLEEAIAGAEEAGLAWTETAIDAGDPIPPPSSLEAIRANPEYAGWILSLVTIDPAALDDTVERVNITLPRRILRRLDDEARAAGEIAVRLYRQARDRPVIRESAFFLPFFEIHGILLL
jgi:predicted RNase H-like HicB family nuclease